MEILWVELEKIVHSRTVYVQSAVSRTCHSSPVSNIKASQTSHRHCLISTELYAPIRRIL